MALHTPKIEYGEVLPLTIQFEYPEAGMGQREQADPQDKELVSISGKTQVSVDHVLLTKQVKFAHLSEAKLDAIEAFFKNCAGLGKPFRYYEDGASANFKVYELKERKYQPRRTAGAGENIFWNEIAFTFKRVDGDAGREYVETEILNDQAAAVDLVGVQLSSSDYKSVRIFFEIIRRTDIEERVTNGFLTATYKTSTNEWGVTPSGSYDGDEHGLVFSMDGDQLQYTSDQMLGANYAGTMKIKSLTF